MKLRHKIWALATLAATLLAGCDSALDDRTTLHFVGDSLVARWDLQNSFSSLATYNLGRSGAGIAYIESLAGQLAGKNAVILIGTNDNLLMIGDDSLRDYSQRYLAAIEALGAERVYLYSVPPRDFAGDRATVNDDISRFNTLIETLTADSPHITYIGVYDDFVGDDGKICLEYYNDRLHLSPQGYEILTQKLFDRL